MVGGFRLVAPLGTARRGRLVPNANLLGGKTFASPASFAAHLSASGNKTVSLFPGQSFIIKTRDSRILALVKNENKNAFFTVTTDSKFPASNVIFTVKPTAKPGQSDQVRLETMGLDGYKVSEKPLSTVPFTLSVLSRGAP